eukprot:scaffold33659_cov148-Skeletonema_menzelii.AAC.2
MATDAYKIAASYCANFIDHYNEVSAAVMYLEDQAKPVVTYEDFWGLGASVVDGAYDFASQFLYFNNFTAVGNRVSCLADCYVAPDGGEGCAAMADWMPNLGTISPETYCSLQWDLIDQGFNKLKICGAKAIGGSPTLDRSEMVRDFQLETFEQQYCHFDYCQPANPTEACPTEEGGSEKLFKEYKDEARVEGRVCGYAEPIGGLSSGAIAGIVIGCVAAACLVLSLYYVHRLKQQRLRYKKRFVQTVARNVSIAPSPGGMSADKLAAEFKHIDANGDGNISKTEMKDWLQDGKLGEISDTDFDAMWEAISGGDDTVNAIEFFVFLSSCGDAFDDVYNEQEKLSKEQRIALASRRLSAIAARDIKEKVEA